MCKKNVALVLLLIQSASLLEAFGQKTFFASRSQSADAAAELVGVQQLINICDPNCDYTVFSMMAEYNRSFHNEDIACFLFGGNSLTVLGSAVSDRPSNALLADYFGLPRDYSSCVCVEPVITNFVMHFDWYMSLESLLCGLYFRAHLPIVNTKWDLNLDEHIGNRGNEFQPAGYMGSARVNRTASTTMKEYPLADSFIESLRGETVFGDLREPLLFGKVNGRQILTRASEIYLTVGWNFLCDDWYNVGTLLRMAIPAGNRPSGEFLFEAIVGNMDHWELGVGLNSFVNVWSSCNDEHKVSLYGNFYLSHLFASNQRRSYDFKKNGPGSRYMLLECIGSPANDYDLAGQPAANQYVGRLVYAINHTTLESKIRIPVQAELVLKCAYQSDCFELDLGYNFWGRSGEKLVKRDCFPSDMFAAKGDAQIYGFEDGGAGNPIALNATQHCATIYKGQSANGVTSNADFTNQNADNAAIASNSNGPLTQLTVDDQAALGIGPMQINGSRPAIFLSDTDINECSALLPKATTHKLFMHMGIGWNDECFAPFVGVGSYIEWGTANPCSNSGNAQWGIWIKGGFSF